MEKYSFYLFLERVISSDVTKRYHFHDRVYLKNIEAETEAIAENIGIALFRSTKEYEELDRNTVVRLYPQVDFFTKFGIFPGVEETEIKVKLIGDKEKWLSSFHLQLGDEYELISKNVRPCFRYKYLDDNGIEKRIYIKFV